MPRSLFYRMGTMDINLIGSSHALDGPTLVRIARAAITSAMRLPLAAAGQDAPWLQQPGASFVTLTQRGRLRGCIGSLTAWRSLGEDVKANAVAAALHDSRFVPLSSGELDKTRVEVSVLSAQEPLEFDCEAQALGCLRPGLDGVVLEYGRLRSTFLPQVWEQLPTASEFMSHLKHKAGLPADFWSPELRLWRYSVLKFKEADPR